jgi:hypothetical protein
MQVNTNTLNFRETNRYFDGAGMELFRDEDSHATTDSSVSVTSKEAVIMSIVRQYMGISKFIVQESLTEPNNTKHITIQKQF